MHFDQHETPEMRINEIDEELSSLVSRLHRVEDAMNLAIRGLGDAGRLSYFISERQRLAIQGNRLVDELESISGCYSRFVGTRFDVCHI